ncbi:hypothetical protein ALQ48_03425 [Pseudomonas coronafaciens pv. zizaniae]|nr:hypothetical protein ALQ48_03425 [Pseudomonas coronafaciens pv. zizaniae]
MIAVRVITFTPQTMQHIAQDGSVGITTSRSQAAINKGIKQQQTEKVSLLFAAALH